MGPWAATPYCCPEDETNNLRGRHGATVTLLAEQFCKAKMVIQAGRRQNATARARSSASLNGIGHCHWPTSVNIVAGMSRIGGFAWWFKQLLEATVMGRVRETCVTTEASRLPKLNPHLAFLAVGTVEASLETCQQIDGLNENKNGGSAGYLQSRRMHGVFVCWFDNTPS